MTALRPTPIIGGMVVVKLLWAIAAQLLWLTAVWVLPMLVLGVMAARVVKEDLEPGAILAAFIGWSIIVVKVATSGSRTAAALKNAHRRFVYPFGEV